MENEVFLEIPGWPGYKISNYGMLLSCWKRGKKPIQTKIWRKMKFSINKKSGHLTGAIYKNKQRMEVSSHGLVILVFGPPKPEGMECCHKDGNPNNNHISNLEWGTHSQNMKDKIKHKTSTKGLKNPACKLNEEKVILIRKASGTLVEIGNEFNISPAQVYRIKNRQRWGHIN